MQESARKMDKILSESKESMYNFTKYYTILSIKGEAGDWCKQCVSLYVLPILSSQKSLITLLPLPITISKDN